MPYNSLYKRTYICMYAHILAVTYTQWTVGIWQHSITPVSHLYAQHAKLHTYCIGHSYALNNSSRATGKQKNENTHMHTWSWSTLVCLDSCAIKWDYIFAPMKASLSVEWLLFDFVWTNITKSNKMEIINFMIAWLCQFRVGSIFILFHIVWVNE